MVEKQGRASRGVPIIGAEHSSETLSTHDRPALALSRWLGTNQLISEALMIPLTMIMRQIWLDYRRQRPLAQQEHLRQGFLRDGAHKPFPCTSRLGLRGGKTAGSTPLPLRRLSNACVNIVSRSWSRYRLPRRKPSKGSINCRAHCCMKAAVRCEVIPAIWTSRVASFITTST